MFLRQIKYVCLQELKMGFNITLLTDAAEDHG